MALKEPSSNCYEEKFMTWLLEDGIERSSGKKGTLNGIEHWLKEAFD